VCTIRTNAPGGIQFLYTNTTNGNFTAEGGSGGDGAGGGGGGSSGGFL